MAADLFGAFEHILNISKLLGLVPLIKADRKFWIVKRILANVWIVILMTAYGYLFAKSVYQKNLSPDPNNWLSNVIVQIRTILGGAIFVVMVATTPFRRKDLTTILNHLHKIDGELKILSIDRSYDREKRNVNIIFYIPCFFVVLFMISEIQLKGSRKLDPLQELSNMLALFVHFVSQMQFVTLLYVLKQRFASLNRWISFYYEPYSKTARDFYWVSPVGVTNSHLTVVGRIHDELCVLAKKVEKMYAFRLLLIISHCFVILIFRVYYISSSVYRVRPTNNIISSVIAVMFDLMQIFMVVLASSSVSRECYKTVNILHRLERARPGDVNHKIDVTLFSLQILHGRVNFSACGLFPLNFTLLQSIMGAVTTYLIIIVQFDITAQNKPPINNRETKIEDFFF